MNLYERVYNIVRGALRAIWRISVEGQENIPSGGFVVACNHTSMSDALVLAVALNGRRVCYMSKKELFRVPLLGRFLTGIGAFPVDRGGADLASIKRAISVVDSGEILGIFPQGTRCPHVDPRETEVKGGVGMLVYRAKADVLPVFIVNKSNKTSAFRKNHVVIGPVISFDELVASSEKRDYQKYADEIFRRMCALKYGEALQEPQDGGEAEA